MPKNRDNARQVVICVDDEQIVLNSVAKQLQRAIGKNYDYELAESAEEAQEIIEDLQADGDDVVMIISDQIMPSTKGDEFLVAVHKKNPEIIKILLTGQAALESAVNAINNADLFRYLAKPWDESDFILTVKKGLERYELLKKLREQLKSFQRFVPKEFLESLSLDNYEAVEPKQAKELEFSVLFMDVRNFTSISEKLGAENTFKFLNDLFQGFSAIIGNHHGFIDKYIGDAIMAIFKGDTKNAVNAGLDMLDSLDQLNRRKLHEDIFPVRIGIGVNVGKVILGVVGSDTRLDTTVIGDVVNTSSRLENLTKQIGVKIIISEHVEKDVRNNPEIKGCYRLVYCSFIRGKQKKLKLYEVFSKDGEKVIAVKKKTLSDFEKGVQLYADGEKNKAKLLFEKCHKVSGDLDPTIFYYLDMLDKGENTGKAADVALKNTKEYYDEIFGSSSPIKKEKVKTTPPKTTSKKAAPKGKNKAKTKT